MAPHSSTLAWRTPWTEKPDRLQSMGSRRVGHDWVTSLSLFTFMHWRRNGNPLQCSCLENPRDGGAWWAAVYGVAQSWTWLKRLSSSSSNKNTGMGYHLLLQGNLPNLGLNPCLLRCKRILYHWAAGAAHLLPLDGLYFLKSTLEALLFCGLFAIIFWLRSITVLKQWNISCLISYMN